MADLGKVTVEICLDDPRAFRALRVVLRTLAERAEYHPHDAELERAVRAGRYLLRHAIRTQGPKG